MNRRDVLKILASLSVAAAAPAFAEAAEVRVDYRGVKFKAFHTLVTLENPAWEAPIYIVSGSAPIISRGNEYLPVQISIDHSGQFPKATFIDHTGVLLPLFREMAVDTQCQWELVCSDALDAVVGSWDRVPMSVAIELRAA
jgi:hypothetical protein